MLFYYLKTYWSIIVYLFVLRQYKYISGHIILVCKVINQVKKTNSCHILPLWTAFLFTYYNMLQKYLFKSIGILGFIP